MDRWMIQYLHAYLEKMETALQSYELWNLVGYTRSCVEVLTNTYIRMNRSRWKEEIPDVEASYTLTYVLEWIAKMIAPMAPFLSEWMYQTLHPSSETKFVSVHSQYLTHVPCSCKSDLEELSRMEVFQRVVELARKIRVQHKVPLKQPLSCLKVISSVSLHSLREILQGEVNVEEVLLEDVKHLDKYVTRTLVPNLSKLGKRFGKQAKEMVSLIGQGILPEGVVLGEEVVYQYQWKDLEPSWVGEIDEELVVCMDLYRTDRLKEEGELREYVALVNLIRREHHLKAMDRCRIRITPLKDSMLQERFQERMGEMTVLVFDLTECTSSYKYGDVYMVLDKN